jgi:hypothetical protein
MSFQTTILGFFCCKIATTRHAHVALLALSRCHFAGSAAGVFRTRMPSRSGRWTGAKNDNAYRPSALHGFCCKQCVFEFDQKGAAGRHRPRCLLIAEISVTSPHYKTRGKLSAASSKLLAYIRRSRSLIFYDSRPLNTCGSFFRKARLRHRRFPWPDPPRALRIAIAPVHLMTTLLK